MNNELIPFVPGDKNRPLNFWPSISITFFWNVAKFQSMVVTDMESCVQSWNIIDFVYFAAKKKIPKNFYGKYLIGADRFEVLAKTLNSQFSLLPILKNLLYIITKLTILQAYYNTIDKPTTDLLQLYTDVLQHLLQGFVVSKHKVTMPTITQDYWRARILAKNAGNKRTI